MCSNFLLLALCISTTHSSRKIPVSMLNISATDFVQRIRTIRHRSNVTNASEKVATVSVMGVNDTSAIGSPETASPDYTKRGRCCYRLDRFKERKFRWFYRMTKTKDGKEVYRNLKTCPGKKWWTAPGKRLRFSHKGGEGCGGQHAYNVVGYKEDTDWVLCCKVGQKQKYFSYGGKTCQEKGGGVMSTCTNRDCLEYNDVDERTMTCPSTRSKKIVNPSAAWACPAGKKEGDAEQRPEKYPDFTDMQCAGYANDCEQTYCIKNSINYRLNSFVFGDSDCSERCAAVGGLAAHAGKPRASKSGAAGTVVNHFWLLLPLVAGAFC